MQDLYENVPTGHLKAMIEEIGEHIRTDKRHLAYLIAERQKYSDELQKRIENGL